MFVLHDVLFLKYLDDDFIKGRAPGKLTGHIIFIRLVFNRFLNVFFYIYKEVQNILPACVDHLPFAENVDETLGFSL